MQLFSHVHHQDISAGYRFCLDQVELQDICQLSVPFKLRAYSPTRHFRLSLASSAFA